MEMVKREKLLKDARKMIKMIKWQMQNIDEVSQALWNTRQEMQGALNLLEESLARICEQKEGIDGT